MTVTDTLPSGETATAISGTGWSCTLSTLICTRSDALSGNSSYPPITLTVNVAINASSSVTNTASVSGGGENNTSNDTANDVTTINACNPIVVTNNNDSGAGSLRQAITTTCNGNTITFAPNVTGTITLASELAIDNDLTIQGPGANVLTISGNNVVRVFNIGSITPSINALSGLTIAYGSTSGSGGGISNGGTLTLTNSIISSNFANNAGGGIYNIGTLTLTNSPAVNNFAAGYGSGGGGIFSVSDYTLTITNSAISGNATYAYGGGIFSRGPMNVTSSAISGNTAYKDGCGIYNFGTLTLTNSTVSNNSAAQGYPLISGGGIQNYHSTLTIINSTISGNIANYDGGGILNDSGTLTITNSTISGNSVTGNYFGGGGILSAGTGTVNIANSTISGNTVGNNNGGGVYIDSGGANVKNTIIAGNSAATSPDVYGPFTTQGYNLIGKSDGSTGFTNGANGDRVGTNATPIDARLAPLGNNGGATLTHALLANSTAINAGTSTGAPTTDQRGAPRVGFFDIGAFELNNNTNNPGSAYVAALPNGTVNQSYSQTLAASNVFNGATFSYAVTSGALPPGLSLTTSFAPEALVAITGTPMMGGTYNFTITATGNGSSVETNYSITILSPTAASVSVGGRALTATGRGIRNVRVSLTDAQGSTRIALTNAFGFYHFADVASGETYILSVSAKRYQFENPTQVLSVNEEIENVNFTALPKYGLPLVF